MSEFQYVGFRAIDSPLSDRQLAFMERQSSRAKVTRWSFENTYQFGDFGGNPDKMLREGYDVHVHYANFGIRKLSLRLPQGLPLPEAQRSAYLDGEVVTWKPDRKGPAGILTISPDIDPSHGEELWDIDRYLDRLADLRQQLADGDPRALYVGWLCACDCGILEPETTEPPVPAGLSEASDGIMAMLEFYSIDAMTLAAAAEKSPESPPRHNREAEIAGWLETIDAETLRTWLLPCLAGEPAVAKTECLKAFHDSKSSDPWPVSEGGRTFADILQQSEILAEDDQRLAKEREVKVRKKRLADMAKSPEKYLGEIDRHVATFSRFGYDSAAEILSDLREAIGGEGGDRIARGHAALLRKKHPTKNLLTAALRRHGLLPPK